MNFKDTEKTAVELRSPSSCPKQPEITLEDLIPFRLGDMAWGLKCYRGVYHPSRGIVSEMFVTHKHKLMIVIKHICRGYFGEDVFYTEEEAQAEAKRRNNK